MGNKRGHIKYNNMKFLLYFYKKAHIKFPPKMPLEVSCLWSKTVGILSEIQHLSYQGFEQLHMGNTA